MKKGISVFREKQFAFLTCINFWLLAELHRIEADISFFCAFLALCQSSDNQSSENQFWQEQRTQGDQVGRIFAYGAIIYFNQFFGKKETRS
jgi:hypothetical protein